MRYFPEQKKTKVVNFIFATFLYYKIFSFITETVITENVKEKKKDIASLLYIIWCMKKVICVSKECEHLYKITIGIVEKSFLSYHLLLFICHVLFDLCKRLSSFKTIWLCTNLRYYIMVHNSFLYIYDSNTNISGFKKIKKLYHDEK